MKEWKKIGESLYYNKSEDAFLLSHADNPTDEYLTERLLESRKMTFDSLDE